MSFKQLSLRMVQELLPGKEKEGKKMDLFENLFQNKQLLRSLLKQVDLLNTINGGSAMTSVDVIGEEDCIVIKISAPSVNVEAFKIELNYTKLSISILTKNPEAEFGGNAIEVPMFMRTFDIPAFVDMDSIEAVHTDGELKVILPYKSTSEGLQRFIHIRELKK